LKVSVKLFKKVEGKDKPAEKGDRLLSKEFPALSRF